MSPHGQNLETTTPPCESNEATADPGNTIPLAVGSTFSPTAGTHVGGVYELVTMILLHLSYHDLLHCVQVCSAWHALIINKKSAGLRRLLFKNPTEISNDEPNPHFAPPSHASSVAPIPHGHEPVLERSQQHLFWFLDFVLESSHPETVSERYEKYWRRIDRMRGMFQGVRIPNGWPVGLREIHCNLCDDFHTRFLHSTLHPLLSFLEDVDICFKGNGGRMLARIGILHCGFLETPASCWVDYGNMYLHYAKCLKAAVDTIDRCKLQDDFCTRPICTQLVIPRPELVALHDANGLKLQQVVNALIFEAKHSLTHAVMWVNEHIPGRFGWGRWFGGQAHDERIRFPTKEHFDRFCKEWPTVKERFIGVANEIKELMTGVEAWEWEEWPQ